MGHGPEVAAEAHRSLRPHCAQPHFHSGRVCSVRHRTNLAKRCPWAPQCHAATRHNSRAAASAGRSARTQPHAQLSLAQPRMTTHTHAYTMHTVLHAVLAWRFFAAGKSLSHHALRNQMLSSWAVKEDAHSHARSPACTPGRACSDRFCARAGRRRGVDSRAVGLASGLRCVP